MDTTRRTTSKTKERIAAAVLSACATFWCSEASALPRGAPQYPSGVDTLYAADYPPIPGLFMFGYGLRYEIDNVRDGNGRRTFNGFRGSVTGFALRPLVVWDTTFLGARPISYIVLPFLNTDITARSVNTFAPPGAPVPAQLPYSALNGGRNGQSNFGLGDITLSQNLNWKFGKEWSFNAGIDIWAPVGDYNKNRFFNVAATNAWTFYPGAELTWRSEENHHFSFKAQYGFSTRNAQNGPDIFTPNGLSLARYQGGQHVILEGAVGYGVTKAIGVDLTGFALIQTTSDKQFGQNVANSKTQLFGLGPQLRFNVGPGAIAVKWQKEFDARNSPQGNRFWIQAGIPLWIPESHPAEKIPLVRKF